MENTISVDDVVRMSIEDLFRDQLIPDEMNRLGNGKQHKAPDHLILDGEIAIERKSRNAVDQSQFYEKLQKIADQQGAPFWAVGRMNFKAIIRQLPDPDSATKKMTDFMMNQVMKTVRKSEKKFEEYEKFVPKDGQLRVLIISDNTKIREGTASIEHFIGRKVGALSSTNDPAQILDAIFYIKDPRYTLDERDSYWFKVLIRERLSADRRQRANGLAAALHHRISHYGPYFQAAGAFTRSSFRTCFV
ncbi:hypothetical protein [Rhizobium esperanzae]|uniref:Uncharacterized protein n=1 Tax=Rhizobium esperanzae TaxID=1967781 RepID=A0A7W6R5A3_9HYPH|nr:hypothetical protein [Rhizobium esperanzae]MBB4236452.1 hypothetical protein [Rhizobium esperanzae]